MSIQTPTPVNLQGRKNYFHILRSALILFLILMLVTGVLYPLCVTVLAQVFFPHQANGSQITTNGQTVGSELIGQPFSDPKYFWGRLSATPDFPYNANYSSGSNLGPNDPRLNDSINARISALHTVDPNNTAPIPIDLVTASASGLDPDISPEAALYQAPRVAWDRNLSTSAVENLVNQFIQPPQFLIFGEPRVNVLELNIALDQLVNETNAGLAKTNATTSGTYSPEQYVFGVPALDVVQLLIFFLLFIILIFPLGKWMYNYFSSKSKKQFYLTSRIESGIFRMSDIHPEDEMDWKTYAASMLLFNGIGIVAFYVILSFQGVLPLNPNGFPSISPDLAFNTAVSFGTNTNWQAYAGEAQLSFFSQMLGATVQNFLSAASGIAVLLALIRGITRKSAAKIGNFWKDLLRAVLFLLPIAIILSLVLVSQGSVQTFTSSFSVPFWQPLFDANGHAIQQTIQMGPVASQEAIKLLGSNGGGFFNANSAHPFENPTPLTNIISCLAIVLIPASFCTMFGHEVGNRRQGMAIFSVMLIIFVGFLLITIGAEVSGNPLFSTLPVTTAPGNMEGKEVRFGTVFSALFATLTTATGNGSVNAMMESFTPLGSLGPLLLMQLGEIVFGGVGSGLYSMLVFVLVAVFIAGLMVGRTPEYLGKKLGPQEMKFAVLILLIPIVTILIGTTVAVMVPIGASAINSPGPHGFTEIVYAFTSAVQNNGSAFAGLNANNVFYNLVLAIGMLIGRYVIAWFTIALAGSLAAGKSVPVSTGTLRTDTPLFVGWLICVILIVGVLSFIPVLTFGPIVEAIT